MTTHRPAKVPMRAHVVQTFKRNAGWGASAIAASMVIGTLGFHLFAKQEWIDAWLNAAMLLGGMGPVGELGGGNTGKLFASFFALYAGLVFLLIAALLLQPVFHHVLHRYHLEDDGKQ